ncbi:MAG TPA: cell envelope integrity protein TolA, partial [Enterovirga sp.]|nr:cell envelope integrity protein TolA [Enterovirga sp.]
AKLEAAKKAEAKAQAELKALAEAAAAKAEAESKAKAEAAQKALAEAKAKAEADAKAKALAMARAKAEAEAKARKQAELADKFDAGDIRQLLASKAPSQSAGAAAPEINKTASLGTATGSAQRLNPSQRDQLMGLLRDQLHRCWQAPMASQGNDKPPVPSVRVKLNQDGSLAAEPAVMNPSSDALFRTVADSATRATRRCAPLKIPAQFAPYYQDWKDLVVNFDPREMG